jgi:hypothetical protein
MSYTIKNSAQTVTYTVNDGTANTNAISLTLIGKSLANYGTALNENFVYLLENFSNTSSNPPAYPVQGQLWWDSTYKFLNVYDNSAWKTVYGNLETLNVNSAVTLTSSLTASALTASALTASGGGQLIGYHTGAIGANTANTGAFTTVTTTGTIVSQGTITGTGQVIGYHTGAIGANTANTGVFTTANVNTTLYAATINANVVGNVGSSHYGTIATNAQPFITSVGTLSSLTVGGNILLNAAGAKITFNTGGGTIANNIGNSLQFYTDGGTVEEMRLDNAGNLNVYGGAVRAATINAGTIGNSGATFTGATYTATGNITAQTANMYAANHIANTATYSAAYYWANGTVFSSGGTFTGGTISSAIVPSSNASINIGGTGSQYFNNVYAVNFIGTSTTAKYADLAEKYLPDTEYEVGTVMMVGGRAEVTQHNGSSIRAIGVISEYPAYKMNSDLNGGVYVALKGRVPVKVLGPVAKGDSLAGTAHGIAYSQPETTATTFAIALENYNNTDIGLIEAVIL